jgi:hypothetical protein
MLCSGRLCGGRLCSGRLYGMLAMAALRDFCAATSLALFIRSNLASSLYFLNLVMKVGGSWLESRVIILSSECMFLCICNALATLVSNTSK